MYEENKYDIVEKYLSPDLKKIEIVPKIENDPIFKISFNDYFKITGQENRLKEDGDKKFENIKGSELYRVLSESFNENKYDIDIDENLKIVQVFRKPSPMISIKYNENEMNKFLDKDDEIRLKFYSLKLPSTYKDVSLEEFQEALDTGLKEAENLKKTFDKKVIKYVKNSDTGLLEAKTVAKKPHDNTIRNKEEYNTLIKFNDNMRQLRKYKELTGTGIIHFNNPLQLLDRVELLAGSIFAGNNGEKQEFTQIAHLPHQLKVITKKQLNDLLKKYILNK